MNTATLENSPRTPEPPAVGVPPLATSSATGCYHCDTFGGQKTYANQACMPLNGRVVCVDWCIHQIVAALNAGGVRTTACCCGHGRLPGRIDLEDGRIITIALRSFSETPSESSPNTPGQTNPPRASSDQKPI